VPYQQNQTTQTLRERIKSYTYKEDALDGFLVLVEAELETKKALPESRKDGATRPLSRLRTGLGDSQGTFIFQLDTIAKTIVGIEVRRLIGSRLRVAVANEAFVDLPIAIAWSFRVIRDEGRSRARANAASEIR
jgi:hypothetical protein